MFSKTLAFLSLLVGTHVLAQELPAATDYYYCAFFYGWYENQPYEDESRKRHAASSTGLFLASARILNSETKSETAMSEAAAAFKRTLENARSQGWSNPKLFGVLVRDCQSMRARHEDEVFKRLVALHSAEHPHFHHMLPPGRVSAEEIAGLQARLAERTDAKVQDEDQSVAYSFFDATAGIPMSAHHIFTKPGHPSHPGLVFVSRIQAKKQRSAIDVKGSFAGNEQSFNGFLEAVTLMNQALAIEPN